MEALANSEGIPVNVLFQEVDGLFYWQVEDHTVVYQRIESEQVARVLFIKPE